MKKIFKILGKLSIPIIVVVALLFAQARCDLALPDYTANIVNIGIQQSGIEDSVYNAVSQSTMNKLLIFTDEETKESILDNYTFLDKNELTEEEYQEKHKDYKILDKENVYELKDISNEERENLEKELIDPILIVNVLENENFDKNILYEELAKNANMDINTLKNMDLFDLFAQMPYEAKEQLINEFGKQFVDLGESIQSQFTVTGIKAEYEYIGLDVEQMQLSYIFNTGMKMLCLALLAMIITIAVSFLASRIGSKFSKELRKEVVEKVVSFSNKEYKEFSVASLITRSTNDVQQVQMVLIMVLRIVIYAPILGLGALAKVSNSPLAWIIGVAVGAILLLIVVLFSCALPKFRVVQKMVDKINLIFREIITGIPVIRAFSTEKHEEKRFDKANKDLTKVNLFVNRLMTIMMPTMMFIMNGVSILIVWVGASKVDTGAIQVGSLLAFITYSMQIIMSFLMLSMVSIILPRAFVSIKRIGEILNTKNSIEEIANPLTLNNNFKGVVEFKDVYFRYPDATEDVLENISFKAMPGTTTAFIGSTGSGKSTLVNLIPRLFDVTGGKILIDGINIKDLSLKSLRDNIGFIPQKGVLFSGTIESNIKFASEEIDDETMQKAAKIAQATEFINQKEDGYKSEIAQGGNNVSGGQKQRLSIARAIAKNPKIYVFDDSFSALDFKTDAALRKALSKETKNSTIFIVAQRISTILNADQIIVLDQGNIVGIGKHEQLLETCEIYKEIALSQLSEEELS